MGRIEAAAMFAFVAFAACKREAQVVETNIDFVLPDTDPQLAAALQQLELEVWPSSSDACPRLAAWRREVCGKTCDVVPTPRDRGELPEASASMTREADGAWSALRLPASPSGAWQLRVRGLDADGEVLVYGCRAVSADESWTINLWRPWCDDEGTRAVLDRCLQQFHPSCVVGLDCDAVPSADDPDGVAPPVCRAERGFEQPWIEANTSCEPKFFIPCHPAFVICEPGRLTPERDGVCPKAPATMCGVSLEEDLDCDGETPGPCGQCDAAIEPLRRCRREDDRCFGTAMCTPEGSWGACIYLPNNNVEEKCDGADDDCDGLADRDDPDALESCNRGLGRGREIADSCSARGCRCGAGAPCSGETCRAGACVPIATPIEPIEPIEKVDAGIVRDAGGIADSGVDVDAELIDGGARDSGIAPDANRRDN